MAIVADRISLSDCPVVTRGYLYRPGDNYPTPLGTETCDYWFRHNNSFRVVVPDGSGRWVGAKKEKGLIVLQKRANKKLFKVKCGRVYCLRFQPPDYLEQRAEALAQKIESEIGEWGNRFSAGMTETSPMLPKRAPSLFKAKHDKRLELELARNIDEGELEYLILSCGQGYYFNAELFFDFFEQKWTLEQIKRAIARQRAVGNVIRRTNGFYWVVEI